MFTTHVRMDAEHRRKKKKKFLLFLLFLLALLRQTEAISDLTRAGQNNSSQSASCSDNEYENANGVCCDKCPPGFKLSEECAGKGLRSRCTKCSNGTFIERTNYFPNCFTCRKCNKKNSFEITACTPITDAECGCEEGYFLKMINANTWSCHSCKQCGDGERLITKCAGSMDTVCQCKDFYYRVNKKKCEHCTKCSEECNHLCPVSTPEPPRRSAHPTPGPTLPTILIPITVLTTVLAVVVIGYEVYKQWRKRRSEEQRSCSYPESPDPEKNVGVQSLTFTQVPVEVDESPLIQSHCVVPTQNLVLPDCVPREIKSHEFIYFVLNVIPISRFKELARRLDISEQDIERAERDNRAFFDAQYQMLKLWSDRGLRVGRNILPQSLVHEFIGKLKDMNLRGCAESIESQYCTGPGALSAHLST